MARTFNQETLQELGATMAMTQEDFARHVKACSLFIMAHSYGMARDKIEDYLATNVPAGEAFWREPIRVMAMGGYYYSADEWMKAHAE